MAELPKNARRGAWLAMPSGGVLAVCFFLPAVKGCGSKPDFPYEYPFFSSPYILGLLVCLGLIWFLASGRFPARLLNTAVSLVTLFGTYVTVAWCLDEADRSSTTSPEFLVCFAASYVAVIAAWHVVTALAAEWRQRPAGTKEGFPRFVVFGGMGSVAWFSYFVMTSAVNWKWDELLYGLWLSFFSSLGILAGGFLMEESGDESGVAS